MIRFKRRRAGRGSPTASRNANHLMNSCPDVVRVEARSIRKFALAQPAWRRDMPPLAESVGNGNI